MLVFDDMVEVELTIWQNEQCMRSVTRVCVPREILRPSNPVLVSYAYIIHTELANELIKLHLQRYPRWMAPETRRRWKQEGAGDKQALETSRHCRQAVAGDKQALENGRR
jgi:hypothetical protein